MGIPFLSPARTVLLITDEALQIHSAGFAGTKLVDVLPWDAEDFVDAAAQVIAKDCGRKPVVIVHDMVEQYYRKERVPNVGIMDKKNVMARKLMVTFPNYPVRGSLELKEKITKTEGSLAASIYIFSAVAESEQLSKTLSAVRKSLANVVCFSMLPVEASDMVATLSQKAIGKQIQPAEWTVFMGQHKSGGLRQIVIKNGELALTRLTPMVDSDMDPDHWAQDMHNEFRSTLSYLLRFGYSPSDPLDVIAISNPPAAEILQNSFEENVRVKTLTSHQAAKHLGVNIEKQLDGRYADPLHVSWIGQKRKFVLPMQAETLNKVAKPRQMAALGVFLLLCTLGYQSFDLFDKYQIYAERAGDNKLAMQRNAQLDAQYQREIERKEALGFDIKLLQSSIAVYNDLQDNDINVLHLFSELGRALPSDLRVDNITITRPEPVRQDEFLNYGEEPVKSPLYVVNVNMSFPNTTNIDQGNAQVLKIQEILLKALPDHEIEVTKLLRDYEFQDELVLQTGDRADEQIQVFESSFEIRGFAPEVKEEGAP